MTVNKTGAVSTNISWEAIDWQTVDNQVRRLQMRIAKAVRDRKYSKAKALQWILTHSFELPSNFVYSIIRQPYHYC